jgi:hypothetical protein
MIQLKLNEILEYKLVGDTILYCIAYGYVGVYALIPLTFLLEVRHHMVASIFFYILALASILPCTILTTILTLAYRERIYLQIYNVPYVLAICGLISEIFTNVKFSWYS